MTRRMLRIDGNRIDTVRPTVRGLGRRRARRGFTLMEILIAIFILTVGLVMVATVFPVAANWTRQDAERTVAGLIARNAAALIKSTYTVQDMTVVEPINGKTTPVTFTQHIEMLPNLSYKLPWAQRAYAFGANPPYPAGNPAAATFYWTALVSPAADGAAFGKFNLYILVFKVNDHSQLFTFTSAADPVVQDPSGGPGGRGATDPYFIPEVLVSSTGISDANFPMDSEGIGMNSGTVFRKIPGGSGSNVASLPPIIPNEPVIFVPPSPGNSVDPLVYVYETTLSF